MTLRMHASSFTLARGAAGLHLNPAQCVLIISCIEKTDQLRFAISNCLAISVPEYRYFVNQTSGKYLGWRLNVNCTELSYGEPLATLYRELVKL